MTLSTCPACGRPLSNVPDELAMRHAEALARLQAWQAKRRAALLISGSRA